MKSKTGIILVLFSVTFLFGIFVNSAAQNRPVKNTRPTFIQRLNRMDTVERTGVFISYPTNFIAATLKVGYEFKVAHNKGLKLIGSFGSSNSAGDYYGLNQFNEFGLEAQLRFYVLRDHPALNGLYLAPYTFYKSMDYQISNSYFDYTKNINVNTTTNNTVGNFCIGYIIGYQYIYNSTLTIDAFIGGGNDFISGNNSNGTLSNSAFAYRSGIDIHTGIGLGIAF